MKEGKEPVMVRLHRIYDAARAKLPGSRRAMLLSGALLSVGLGGLAAVWNISSGPLSNLNDIGSWNNRLLFIAMTAAVQVMLHALVTLLYRGGYARLLLRHALLFAGFVIGLLAINQKTYAFVEQMLPMIRQMDAQGLAAIGSMETNLSSSALTLVYAITRGPVYDMYLLKLACIAAFCLLCILALRFADRMKLGIRAEVLFALCLILPQGFMSAACAAQTDVIAVALLAASLLLVTGERPNAWAGAIVYGIAVAVSGACLYALPVYLALWLRGRVKGVQLFAALLLVLAAQVPAVLAGQKALDALASPLRALVCVPEFAAGSANIMNVFPRAAMEEMPEYFMLRQLPNIDAVTNFSPYYTQASFSLIMVGLSLAGLALYAMAWPYVLRREMSVTAKGLALMLSALLVSPGATAGSWLLLAVAALYAILTTPRLRVPACVTLFAAMCAAAYPVTGESMLPMETALLLCLLALFDLLGMFDANRKEGLKV